MSPRARVIAVVSVVAAAAAGTAVGGALLQGRADDTAGEADGQTSMTAGRGGPPALELVALAPDEPDLTLREAERLYETGKRDEARERFEEVLKRDPDSVEAAVGSAVAAWPKGTIPRLRRLVGDRPGSGVARLNLGLALVALGKIDEARGQWREAETRDPDSPAALRAEDLLNPESPPGRPVFISTVRVSPDFVRAVARGAEGPYRTAKQRAEAGDPNGYLRLGLAFQQLGRRLSAREAFDRGAEAAPKNIGAQTAAAVVRFDKDDPSKAFSRLGPLAAGHPRSPVVRFHLGLLLLWLPDVDEARRQLRLASVAAPRNFYGREARRILARLEDVK